MSRDSSDGHFTPLDSNTSKRENRHSTYRETSSQPPPFLPPDPAPPHLSVVETRPPIVWEDLELMRQFVTATYATCSRFPSVQNLWQTTIPKMASDYPFLMHSLLSTSALHLAFLNPTKRSLYLAAATRHHDVLLPAYRSQLHNVTADNSSAMFICSLLISLCTLAFPVCSNTAESPRYSINDRQQPQSESPVQLVNRTFFLLQGASTFVRDCWPWLNEGPVSALFQNRFQSLEVESDTTTCVSSSHPAVFQRLITHINSLPLQPSPSPSSPTSSSLLSQRPSSALLSFEEQSTYHNTVTTLQRVFTLIESSDTDNGAVLMWPFLLERAWGFAALLKEMRPLSLVILAYYGVALHASRSHWYIGDWGQRLVIDVSKTLAVAGGGAEDSEWDELMAWPLEMVKNGESLDKA